MNPILLVKQLEYINRNRVLCLTIIKGYSGSLQTMEQYVLFKGDPYVHVCSTVKKLEGLLTNRKMQDYSCYKRIDFVSIFLTAYYELFFFAFLCNH